MSCFNNPAILQFLLSDEVHYTTLALVAITLAARYLRSFLPGPRLRVLENTVKELEDTLSAAQENGSSLGSQIPLELIR